MTKIRSRKKLLIVLFGVNFALIALWAFLPLPASAIESLYSRGLYRVLAGAIVPVSSAVPFSLTLVVFVGGAITFIVFWGIRWGQLANEGHFWRGFAWGWIRATASAATLYVLFLFLWGAGYAREDIEVRLELDASSPAPDDVRACAEGLLAIVKESAEAVEERDPAKAIASVSRAMVDVVEEWDGSAVTLPTRVKVLPSGWLLIGGSAGVSSPFFLEPHVDGSLPTAALVAVSAHEIAHVAGYCSEADAELLGATAGLSTPDSFARYSVALFLLRNIATRLPEAEAAAIFKALPPKALEDLEETRAAAERHRVAWLVDLQGSVYDSYLRSQGVDDGVASYDRGTTLIVRAWQRGLLGAVASDEEQGGDVEDEDQAKGGAAAKQR